MKRKTNIMAGVCLATACMALWAGAQTEPAKSPSLAADNDIELGRKLVKIGGCNDCHTPGYAMSNANVPEAAWLTGDSMGWRGPWGTTYPANLRNLAQAMTEDGWVEHVKKGNMRPPMPAYVFRDLTDREIRSIYKFIRSLGAAGQPVPAYVPPDKEPSTPVVIWPAPPPAK